MKRVFGAALALSPVVMCGSVSVCAQTFNWAGSYAGAVIGYANVGPSNAQLGPKYVALPSDSPAFGIKSLTGGVTLGYNWQRGHVVFGAEADMSVLAMRANLASSQTQIIPTFLGPVFNTPSYQVGVGTDWLMTARGRVGLALDRLMIFGTGGLAVGSTRLSTSFSQNLTFGGIPFPLLSASAAGSQDAVRTGYVVGGGAEYALSPHLTAKAEVLYYNLGTGHVAGAGGASVFGIPIRLPIPPYVVAYRFDGTLGRVGANYKF